MLLLSLKSLERSSAARRAAISRCLLFVCFFAGIIALAHEARGDSAAETQVFRPQIKTSADGIRYLSTGIGYDSRDDLPRFTLRLIFSTKTARYLANVEAEITPCPTGNATRIRSIGPWLIVDLPPGIYAVRATAPNGKVVSKAFRLTKGQMTTVNLVWEMSDEDI